MTNQHTAQQAQAVKKLICFIAKTPEIIIEAQSLRFRVFGEELGATLKSGVEGLDYDEYDDYCHHLVVYDTINAKVVGYTRLLNQEQANQLARLSHEYWKTPVRKLSKIELCM